MLQLNITRGRPQRQPATLFRRVCEAGAWCRRASIAAWMRNSPRLRQEIMNLAIYVSVTWLLTGHAPTLTDWQPAQ
jgi:hypothetical protein